MEEQSILATKTYKRAESNLKHKLKSTFLKHLPHYMVPGFNLHSEATVEDIDIENNIEQYQSYPYHCDLPRPLLPPARLPRTVIDEEDPALELLAVKSHMNDDIKRIKHYYQKHQKEFGTVNKKLVKWAPTEDAITTKVPKYVADIAGIIDLDPDPYFQGAYNWYYTGGTLDCVQLNNLNILLFPFAGELVASPIYNIDQWLWKPLLKNGAKCELDGKLYELRHNTNSKICTILGRSKYNCNFYMLSEENDKWRLTQIHRQTSEVPYVSADFNFINANEYCTANVERLVTLWDIYENKRISSNMVLNSKVLDDSWGSVRFQPEDPNVILFVDRCCIHHLDIRIPFDQPALTLCPKSHLETCESLSLDFPSSHNFYRYVGTYHNILMCDNRSPKQCVQQKWTHQFKSPPLMAGVVNRGEKEFIALSSQVPGENTMILNTWTSAEISHSFDFPFTPPSIMETLNASQMQGMCLNPYVRSRFDLCNTGTTMIKTETDDIFLFLQNSIGDVFYQCVTHDAPLDKYSPINCKSYCLLNDWEDALDAHFDTVVPLTISETTNLQHIFESLTNTKLRLKHNRRQSDDYFEPSWKQSLDKLGSYIDILAPELLSVWEVCEEVPMPLTAAPHQKVLSWLESSSAKALIPSQEEPEELSTPVNTQQLMSVSQEQDITCLDDSNVLQELLLPKVRSKPVKKKRRIQK